MRNFSHDSFSHDIKALLIMALKFPDLELDIPFPD
jgi:hypothetical protein